MKENLTPGTTLLLRILPKLVLPSLAVHAVILSLRTFRDVLVPTWIHVLACLLAPYAFLWIRSALRYVKEEREIRMLGAMRVPALNGKLPGNIDLILQRMKDPSKTYPFDSYDSILAKINHIVSIIQIGETRMVTTHPEHVKAMLATDFGHWEKGAVFSEQNHSVLGNGIFNSDGDMWRFHRSMTRPFFSRDRISDFEIVGRHSDILVDWIVERARTGTAFDYQDMVSRFTLDSATEFLLGSCSNSLQEGFSGQSANAHADRYAKALAAVQHRLAIRGRSAPLWRLTEITGDKTKEGMQHIKDFIDPIVLRALQRKADGSKIEKDDSELRLIDHLVAQTDDPKLIFDETLNILFAGRDTTATTLTFMAYLLAMHPDVLQRLRQEVLERVGPTRSPNFDDFREMKYLRAVINETLRLFPPVPANIRAPTKGCTLPPITPGGKPCYIPAGCKVAYIPMRLHRNKEYWGPDADDFDPDRFLDARLHRYLVPNPFIFVPFNAGPRICLGQQFAYNEMSYHTIRLLQRISGIHLAEDVAPEIARVPPEWAGSPGRKGIERIRPRNDLTLYVLGGLWLRFEDAKDDQGKQA